MVIGPLSTLPNWVAEFQRWNPDMPVVLYHGSKQERQRIRTKQMPSGASMIWSSACPWQRRHLNRLRGCTFTGKPATNKFPVVVTSYEIVISDVKFLQKYNWKYVVVDEGHRLKNYNCKLLRELRTIPTDNKLLLSGGHRCQPRSEMVFVKSGS